MKKLINGIVDFRTHVLADYREKFAKLALGQKPDTLFIACSDSRVVPNLFASSDPGDLFVIRNVGNLIPPCGCDGLSTTSDEAEAAAIEFAILNLGVPDIIVCGHSECGAMQAVLSGRESVKMPNLQSWLRHGDPALAKLKTGLKVNGDLSEHNRLSQINVLQQMEHLKTYSIVKERYAAGKLGIHGWWFDIRTADVYVYEEPEKRFNLIDEASAKRILERVR